MGDETTETTGASGPSGAPRRRWVAVAVVAGVVAAGAVAVAVTGDDDAPRGAAAAPFTSGLTVRAADGVVTRPDGGTVETGIRGGVPAFGTLADGRVLVEDVPEQDTSPMELSVFSAEGALEVVHPSAPEGMLVTPGAVAWAGVDGRLRVLRSGTIDQVLLAAPPKRELDRVKRLQAYSLESIDCPSTTDCSVVVHYEVGLAQLPPGVEDDVYLRVGVDGYEEVDAPERSVLATSPDGATEVVALKDLCVGVLDVASDTVGARSCEVDTSFLRFTPDGTRLVSLRSADRTSLVVRDLDLKTVATVPFPPGFDYLDYGWSGAETALFVVMEQKAVVPDPDPGGDRPGGEYNWYLVDVPIDGSPASVREGPVVGPHHDTNQPVWMLRDPTGD